MKKRWLSALLVLTVAGVGSTALGEGAMRIFLSGERIVSDLPGSTASSMEELVNRLGGFTEYDQRSGKMEIIKPNVNVLVLEGVQQSRNKNVVFSNPIKGYSDKDVPRTFNVFVEVDEAPSAKDLRMQVVLIGPDGKEVEQSKVWKFSTQNGNSFYFSEPFVSTKLEQYGTYKVQVQMKTEKFDQYVTVGENSFSVGR
ncbi:MULTISPECIES: hypothetical protein [Brevibacillus]|jgi:hypothetical protein|uniref:Copper amine oxidase-like N-terminal domain-containing protein n=1 Tax=Brevibacillus borstelensis AK1 TaxID=1300222 RepID=M8E5M2_9BACL|nr:hypothetical protein [Brevibacillus borstelensis]EMT54561.1 hypothetical protein I532_03115 [Brevibacillus borstelensis AK1]KKX54338.1 hypothetical protein X546_15020 [Brevibacillus borstelensis cifa_chp40]MBE5395958.1 hypothetical protein [Brevibacillus borstelensis]MCC0563220.1 hypothetical protein [Brevibacillus borstelensis]MCM3471307.1 hypothetical protein [Brevibacillus borstelensis]